MLQDLSAAVVIGALRVNFIGGNHFDYNVLFTGLMIKSMNCTTSSNPENIQTL